MALFARWPVLLSLLAVVGCRSGPAPPAARADPSASEWHVPSEILEPRMMTFSCEEDPGLPHRTLDRWLELLGPRSVREKGDGIARLIEGSGGHRECDWLLRWRDREGALDVQIACPAGVLGDFPRRSLASLAFAMEANGVACEAGPPSGCAPPGRGPRESPTWREAIEQEMRTLGLVLVDENVEQGANVTFYGAPGGPPEWQVAWDNLDAGFPATLELSHDSVPFDAKGERDLLVRILERMGVTPWRLR